MKDNTIESHIEHAPKYRNSILAKNRFDPAFILLLFTFANWPDFLHAGDYRILTHNPLAIILVPLIIIYPMHKIQMVNGFQAVSLFSASIIHMLMDIPFSYFYLSYPFSSEPFAVYPGFTSSGDMMVESICAIAFIIVFVHSGEHESTAKFLAYGLMKEKKQNKTGILRNNYRYIYLFIFMAFGLFSLIQLLIFTRSVLISRQAYSWYYILFFCVFSMFVATLGLVFLKMSLFTQRQYKRNNKLTN